MTQRERISLTPAQRFVGYALQIGAMELIPGGRKLKSGRMSPYFFNSGLFKTGHDLAELATAYAKLIYIGDRPKVIFGPAYKGITLAAAIAVTLGNSIEYAFNRKEIKDHGEGGIVVGASLEEKKVCIADDVMTTGTSSGEAVDIIRANGGTPIACVIAFDRQERGNEGNRSAVQEFEKNYGIPVRAVATLADLIAYLQTAVNDGGPDRIGKALDSILAYQRMYGVS